MTSAKKTRPARIDCENECAHVGRSARFTHDQKQAALATKPTGRACWVRRIRTSFGLRPPGVAPSHGVIDPMVLARVV
jgi:hypothetical protein